jgi:hypothetical protein
LKFFLFAEPDGPDGCFLPPIASIAQVKGFKPLGLVELLANKPLVTTGVVRNIVPGWTLGVVMPSNMIFVEVDEVLRNRDGIAIPGQRLVFLRRSGAEVVINGRRYCSPKTDPFDLSVGSRVLLYGLDHRSDVDRVRGRVFEIRDEKIYASPDSEMQEGEEPIPLWQLRQRMEELEAGTARLATHPARPLAKPSEIGLCLAP